MIGARDARVVGARDARVVGARDARVVGGQGVQYLGGSAFLYESLQIQCQLLYQVHVQIPPAGRSNEQQRSVQREIGLVEDRVSRG